MRGGDVVQFGGLDGMAFEGVGCIVLYDTRENQYIWIFTRALFAIMLSLGYVGILLFMPG